MKNEEPRDFWALSFVIIIVLVFIVAISLLAQPANADDYDDADAWSQIVLGQVETAEYNPHELMAELRYQHAVEQAESEQRIAELEAELAEANGIVSAVASLEHVESQIASLNSEKQAATAQLSSTYAQLSAAQAELASTKAATASINTMVQSFTPDMGTVGCREFVGISMTPAFHSQSLVCITSERNYIDNNVGIGKIVIAPCHEYAANLSVIHRVHGVVDGKWQLKGDYNFYPDPCLQNTSDITWIVVGMVRDPY